MTRFSAFRRRAAAIGAAFVLAALAVSGAAVAQPQPVPVPLPEQGVGQPGRGLPPGHPPVGQPAQRRPPPGPGGQPLPPGGMRRPVPVRSPSTAAAAAPAHAAEEHGAAHGEAHCPGHGPLDPPHHVNWWQGLLGVDNEKAQSPSFVNKLLWRYENKNDPCDPKNQPPPFLASALNFLVLVAILYRFGRAPINAALAKRKQAIMGDIEAAARLRRDAKKRLAEYEERFERLEETLEALKADYAAQGQREKERILAEAEERRARMKRDAEFRIEQEMKEARAQLLREAVEGAVRAAEELIRARVNATDMARMADEYLLSIGPALGGAGSGGAAAHSARSGASSISAGQPPVGGVA